MQNYFDLQKINKNILSQIKYNCELIDLCEKCMEDSSKENIEKILKNIQENEKKMMHVKDSIVTMINELNDKDNQINVKQEKNGYKIN